ncbi:hypothetical protein Micbo1qcDRAFT_121355, partial [Microdochium bolleyi]
MSDQTVDRRVWGLAFPLRFTNLAQPAKHLEGPRKECFAFDDLPESVQIRIFQFLFVKDRLVHCLSRLDHGYAPPNFPAESRKRRSELPHRFYWGYKNCNVSTAHKPRNVLKYLLVCKRWCYLGVHAFYGCNTFAFSSLGELGKFFNGIGPARVARIRHIELFWHGSIMAAKEHIIEHDPGNKKITPQNPKIWKTNQRTLPLKMLLIAYSLCTFAIHIAEGDNRRTRRRYEMKYEADYSKKYHEEDIMQQDVFGAMCHRTQTHANHRRFRSLRTCHGIDYIYQLRGMDWIRFYEVNGASPRQPVRDHTFVDDVNSVVTLPKTARFANESALHNL